MRIAQVAPLYESVPPRFYGGTERIVSYLTEELVRAGHDVTLFASGDSSTTARLVPCASRGLRMDDESSDPLAEHVLMLEKVFHAADDFDVIHFHVDYLHFPMSRREAATGVTTLHGRLDIPELSRMYDEYAEMPVVSISDAQRRPLPHANWQATVYHALPKDLYRPRENHDGYLAFLGRVSPEKRLDRAIEIARRAGMPIRVAAKVDQFDRPYFEDVITPLLDDPLVEFVGEIAESEKNAFLGDACALLFPIDWPEPFGLVMVEAMACGTPVIAYDHGSVPEVLDEGVTGFVTESVEAAVDAVRLAAGLDRGRCRARFEERFTADRMAADYLAVYERMLAPARRLVTVAVG